MTELLGPMFFAAVRPLFGGALSQAQVDGLKLIAWTWDNYGDGDDRKLAYLLATAFHETAQTMQPIKETANAKRIDPSDAKVKEILTKAWNGGKLPWVKKDYWTSGFFGRGYVQLTHLPNYQRAGEKLGVNLASNPSLALDPEIAAKVLILGCMDGWFTGKKLGDYFDDAADWAGARRVVNGTDKAKDIALYAMKFYAAFLAAGKPAEPVPASPRPNPSPEPSLPPAGQPDGSVGVIRIIVGAVIAFVLAVVGFFASRGG